jgi:hypothetical protein
MKRTIAFAVACLMAASIAAANSPPQDEVVNAAKRLAAASNYTWKTTVEIAGGRFRPGPTEGKTEKNGFATISGSLGDKAVIVFKNGRGIIKKNSGWQFLADAAKDDGSGQSLARLQAIKLQNFKTPAEEAWSFAIKVKTIQLADGIYAGELTEEAAKAELTPARPGEKGPGISGAKGTAKFWIINGILSKYQIHVEGHVEFGGNGREVNRTTTTEITDVGKTKLEVPDDARKKLS